MGATLSGAHPTRSSSGDAGQSLSDWMRTRLADAAELKSLDESANQSGIWGQEAVQTAKTLRITARRK